MFRIYLAGPISGLNHSESVSWRERITENFRRFSNEITCLSPMRAKDKLKDEGIITNSYEKYGCLYSSRGIMSRDFNDCTTSDLVIYNLLNAKTASIGTMMELAWNYQAKIPTVVIMEKTGNVHDHPMVREAINFHVSSIEEAVAVALTVLHPES